MAELLVETTRRTELVDITAQVLEASARGVAEMVGARALVVFVPHTTAGLVIQASGVGASKVAADLEAALERIVDESWSWQHAGEGDQNPWAHVRAALTSSSLTVPLLDGKPALGDLQTIFLCEFDGPRRRRVLVDVI